MQSQLKSLSKIFSESIFRIPDYQRGYSWEPRHLKDFWNDIEQLTVGKNHYTGVITFEPVGKDSFEKWEDDCWIIESKQYQPLYVVDGQQRMTTAIILLQAIIDRMEDHQKLNYFTREEIKKKYIFETKDSGISKSYIFGYEKDNPSSEFLKQAVFDEKSINHAILEDTIYTRNLQQAREFFKLKLKDLNEGDLQIVFAKLTQNLQFNIFYIEPELDVFVTFETMNNRGKPLSHLELLKNRLIYLSTRFDKEKHEREHLRKAINESWKTVYHYLGKVASDKFTDDIFLRTHFVCYFGPQILKVVDEEDSPRPDYWLYRYLRNDSYKEYLLESYFTPKRLVADDNFNKLTLDEVYAYAQHIKESVQTYYQVASPADSKWSDEEKMVVSAIRRLSKIEVFTFAVAVMLTVKERKSRIKLLRAAERYAFLYKFKPYPFASTDMSVLAVELISGKKDVDAIERECSEVCDNFVASNEFSDAIRGIGKGGGYYTWGALRYFMYEYEQYLRKKSKSSRQLLTWNEYLNEAYESDYKTIEHIFPQKALDSSWRSAFEGYGVAEKNVLKNSLGNLLPVSHSKNASLSNSSFEVKKGSAIVQVGYCYGCLSEIQVSHEKKWGALEILRRGIYLLDFMGERWRIPFGDLDSKIKILGLGFVVEKEHIDLSTFSATASIPTQSEIKNAQDPEVSVTDDPVMTLDSFY
ncbi:DUF262 domain-containing protein [Delftia acidovorans]|uniref:DUF262 domain-containing protein n=1 Tax=Delftia acidovorans TaxID=80866 RepID=UPI000BC715F0|nr:DUF262 domain-containing protein [Delftia acidovorans]SOE37463.1 Protein of unknown function [Delftia acidovorans]